MREREEKRIYTTGKGKKRVVISCIIPLSFYRAIEGLIQDSFMSDSEFMRFCIMNTIIHLSESELTKKIDKSKVKRFIRINGNEVEIDGVVYSVNRNENNEICDKGVY